MLRTAYRRGGDKLLRYKNESDVRERRTEIDNESMIGYKCAFIVVVRWLLLVYAICYTIYFLPHTHVVVRPLLFMSFLLAMP